MSATDQPLKKGFEDFRRHVIAVGVKVLVLVCVCCTWSLLATGRMKDTIQTLVRSSDLRKNLLEAQHTAAISQAVMVAVLLGLVAAGTALVLISRRRFAEQIREELIPFEQAGLVLSSHHNPSDALNCMLHVLGPSVPCDWIRVLEYDSQAEEFIERARYEGEEGLETVDSSAYRNFPLGLRALNDGRTIVFFNLEAVKPEERDQLLLGGTRAGVCIPAKSPVGRSSVMLVAYASEVAIGPEEVRRMEQASVLVVAALERVRLFEEAQTRADDLVMLNEVSRILVETPRVEVSLSQIASLLQRQFQAAGVAVFLHDEHNRQLFVNGVAGRYTEKLEGHCVSLTAPHMVGEAFVRKQQVVVKDVASRAKTLRELVQLLPDLGSGACIPMLATRGPVGVLAVFDDKVRSFPNRALQRLRSVARLAASAVERGALGQALMASEARMQEILDGIPALVIGIDEENKILSFNATAESATGWRRDEAIGKDFLGLLIRQEKERHKLGELFDQALEEGGHSDGALGTLTDIRGQPHRIRWSTEALRDAHGSIQGLVVMGMDYTVQIKLEAQLLQAQKMESVGTLAGGMAHDFNNLLGGILGQVSLARQKIPQDHPLVDTLSKIEAAAQRGTDLTSTLLTFARRSVLQPSPVHVGALIEETAGLLRGSFPDLIQVEVEIAPHLPPVQGNATQLQQVLLNLCVNARDAMPTGGKLLLRASPDERGGVLIDVSDEGIGMADEVKAHLFEPFFTTKEPGKGTGLGLAVVFGVVRSHGGAIEVESEPGKGSCFTIYLPSRLPKAAATTQKQTRSQPPASTSDLRNAIPHSGTEEILLIDDESMLRDTTQELLGRLGYNVKTAPDGGSALNLLDQKKAAPKVILLDVVMPGLSGMPLLWELRQRLPKVPVILISGFSKEGAVQEMLDGGAVELVQKPFRLDLLASEIRRALSKKITDSAPFLNSKWREKPAPPPPPS